MEIVIAIKGKLRSNRGFSHVFIGAMMMVFLLFAFALFEIIRINIIAASVRDKYQGAIITASVENYKSMYQTVREGYAASYEFSGFSWEECNTVTRNKILRTVLDDFTDGESSQITVTGIDFTVESVTPAPGDKNAQRFNIEGQLTVNIPYSFAWRNLPPIRYKVNVKSEWRMMF
ncbi:MAG: hypothetical protein FWH08_00405 [Oscillospiraceae bacterium]|nr:hypothetical protein [Oscillospiraceae bacterium]